MKQLRPLLLLAALCALSPVGPAAAAQSGGKDAGGPAVVTAVAPTYPAIAKASRVKGEVIVEVKIDAQGKVTSAAAVSGDELLRKASEKAAADWRFAPGGESAQARTARLTFAYLHGEDVDPERTREEATVVFRPPYRVEVTLHPFIIN